MLPNSISMILMDRIRPKGKKIPIDHNRHDAFIRLGILQRKAQQYHSLLNSPLQLAHEFQQIPYWELKDQEIVLFCQKVEEFALVIGSNLLVVHFFRKCLQLIGLRSIPMRINLLYLLSEEQKHISAMERYEFLVEAIRLYDYKSEATQATLDCSPSSGHYGLLCFYQFCKITKQQNEFYRILEKGVSCLKSKMKRDSQYFHHLFDIKYSELTNDESRAAKDRPIIHHQPSKASQMILRCIKGIKFEAHKAEKCLLLFKMCVLGFRKSLDEQRRKKYQRQMQKIQCFLLEINAGSAITDQVSEIINTQEYFEPLEQVRELKPRKVQTTIVKNFNHVRTVSFGRNTTQGTFIISKKFNEQNHSSPYSKDGKKRSTSFFRKKVSPIPLICRKNVLNLEQQLDNISEIQQVKTMGQVNAQETEKFEGEAENQAQKRDEQKQDQNCVIESDPLKCEDFQQDESFIIKDSEQEGTQKMEDYDAVFQEAKIQVTEKLSRAKIVEKRQKVEQISLKYDQIEDKSECNAVAFQDTESYEVKDICSDLLSGFNSYLSINGNYQQLNSPDPGKSKYKQQAMDEQNIKKEVWIAFEEIQFRITCWMIGEMVKQCERAIEEESKVLDQMYFEAISEEINAIQQSIIDQLIIELQDLTMANHQEPEFVVENYQVSLNTTQNSHLLEFSSTTETPFSPILESADIKINEEANEQAENCRQNSPEQALQNPASCNQESPVFNIMVTDPKNRQKMKEQFHIEDHFKTFNTTQILNIDYGEEQLIETRKRSASSSNHVSERSFANTQCLIFNCHRILSQKIFTLQSPPQSAPTILPRKIVFFLSENIQVKGYKNYYCLDVIAYETPIVSYNRPIMAFPYHFLQKLPTIQQKIKQRENYVVLKDNEQSGGKTSRLMVVGLWAHVSAKDIELTNSDHTLILTCYLYQKVNADNTVDVLIRLLSGGRHFSKASSICSPHNSSLPTHIKHRSNSFDRFPTIYFAAVEQCDAFQVQHYLDLIIGMKTSISQKGGVIVDENLSLPEILLLISMI